MNSTRHLIYSIFLCIIILACGTIGYMIIERWDIWDSLYMTVITLTTVGFGEVHEVSRIGRVYTILLIFLGGGLFVYIASAIVRFMVEGEIRAILGRKKLDRKINRLKQHYIICGYGRIGRVLCQQLWEKPVDVVVIEKSKDLMPIMELDKLLYICGEASSETTLIDAGIKRAQYLIAVLGTDTDNVFLVLTARQLNQDLFIMARATDEASKAKLYAAGADQVESPYDIGARSMAQRLLRPTVTNFIDLAFTGNRKEIQMEEIPVHPSSKLTNVMLKDSGIRQNFHLIIIAIKKADGTMKFNPSFETIINGHDTVIAVGEEQNLSQLEKILNPQTYQKTTEE